MLLLVKSSSRHKVTLYTTKYLSIAPLNPVETYIFMEVSDQKQIRFCTEDHTLLDFQVFPNTAETCAIVSRRRMTNENQRCPAHTHRGTCPLRFLSQMDFENSFQMMTFAKQPKSACLCPISVSGVACF